MAEKIISPGVFTNEIDQTFLPAAVADIGAALIGPTVKGPGLVPTVVTSYSEYQAIFGDTFKSGSSYATYLTSLAAEQYLKNSDTLTVVRVLDGSFGGATSICPKVSSGGAGVNHYTGSVTSSVDWDASGNASFKLNTIADGAIMNNTTSSLGNQFFSLGTNGIITNSGSKHNIRWEISSLNKEKGTFTLLIRRGDDSNKRKQILETFNNLTLDPNSNNYVAKIIGDSFNTISGTESEPYIALSGSYANKSKYVRVEVVKKTTKYLDENGDIRLNKLTGFNHPSCSLPGLGSGSIHGSFCGGSNGWSGFDSLGNLAGDEAAADYTFYENIGD